MQVAFWRKQALLKFEKRKHQSPLGRSASMSENKRGDSQDWRVDYLILAALWGSSFLFMRMGAAEFGPLATAWTRVCVATLFFIALHALARPLGFV